MARVTNRVAPDSLADLLAAPARATLAWIAGGHPELAPVRYAWDRGRHRVAADGSTPLPGTAASLVLDEGGSWFELRAVTVRGTLASCPDPPGAGTWYELVPERTTAWDYGRLHEEPDA